MDSLAASAAPENDRTESANLLAIKEAFRTTLEDGFEAGLEALLQRAAEDIAFRPYIASDRVLHGQDEVRAYYREAIAAGTEMRLKATSFHESGDEVVVNGTMRVARPTGGFSESQISWTYRFRDGLLADAAWGPRQSS
jgi:ketosteroid isomerase-like protein